MKTKPHATILLICGLLAQGALAQNDADKSKPGQPDQAAMEAAWAKSLACNEHHSRLAEQAGEWDAATKFWMAGPDGPCSQDKGKMVNTMENNGQILKSCFTGEMNGQPFTGTGYTTYDNNRKKHTGVWMDSMSSGIMTQEGEASADGKVLTMVGTYVDPMGQTVKQRMVNTMIDKDSMKFEMFSSSNGAPEVKLGEINYTRCKADGKSEAKPVEAAKPVATAPAGGHQQLSDGLIVEDIVVGTGEVCPPGAKVTMHYRGTLKDGKEFDSSFSRNQPLTAPLGNLIKGWQEGVPGMRVGGKRRLTIPYALAYGVAGRPPVIPPKADLIFDIELLGIAK